MFAAILSLCPGCSKSGDSGGMGLLALLGLGGNTVSAVIGPEGGTLTHRSGASVVIPAGALAADTEISITGHADSRAVSRAYGISPFRGGAEFGPSGQAFLKPVTITLPMGTALQPYEEHSLYVFNGVDTWEDTGLTTSANGDGTRVTAQVTHFSGYASLDIPPAVLEQFRNLWSGGDPSVALGSYIAWFLTTTNFMGYTVRTEDSVAEVVGIGFSVNTQEDGTPGAVASTCGVVTSSMTTQMNIAGDYTGPGGSVLNYDLLVTLYWRYSEAERAEVSVDIIEPMPGAQVSGITHIGTFTRDAARVEFYVDGGLVREDTDAPFGWQWNTTDCTEGSHTLKAIAYDSESATSESETVTVTVNNTTEGPRAVYFTDGDMDEGEIGGTVTIRKADDETSITHYVVYYGDGTRIRLGGEAAIAEIAKTGSDVSCAIPDDTSLPEGATHILAFAKTAAGEVENPVAVALNDSKAGPGVGSWVAQSNFPLSSIIGHTCNSYNSFIYVIGGWHDSVSDQVLYAKINTNGTLGDWKYTTSLPSGRHNHTSVVYNGYLYVLGGYNGTTTLDEVLYAKINSDGSIGSWQSTISLTGSTYNHTSVIYDCYIFLVIGTSVQYASINSDGSLQSWNSAGTLSQPAYARSTCVFNGYLYNMGGIVSEPVEHLDSIEIRRINSDCSLGSSQYATLPSKRHSASSFVYNGWLYFTGGMYAVEGYPNNFDTVSYAKINMNGSLGTWIETTNFNVVRHEHTSIESNGNIYIIGGWYFSIEIFDFIFSIPVIQYAPFVSP